MIDEIMEQLRALGDENTRRTLKKHGAPDNLLGVKVGDMQPLRKKIKRNQEIASALYKTGISDAMYLAGLVGDGSKMSAEDLDKWARSSGWSMISDYTIPWMTCDHPEAEKLALKWIDDEDELVACSGWATLSGLTAIKKDEDISLKTYRELIDRVVRTIHHAPNRVRYTMNGFIIAVGTYVIPLNEWAKAAAATIGKLSVSMGDTSCKIPAAMEYIEKVEKAGKLGKKKIELRC